MLRYPCLRLLLLVLPLPWLLPLLPRHQCQGERRVWEVAAPPRRPKTVLAWTPWWGREGGGASTWGLGTGGAPFAHCPVSACRLSTDRAEQPVELHDAVLFHTWQLFQHDMRLPGRRSAFQRYVLFSIEPAAGCGGLSGWEYGALAGYFNSTASYRRDADVPVPYGRLERRRPGGSGEAEGLLGGKSRSVLFVTSHCVTDSDREGAARRLNRTVAVDFRGACAAVWEGRRGGRGERGRHGTSFHAHLYYFYLAFENSLCHDYVTEKFWDALAAGVVPVVLGGADYAAIAPPRSYIDLRDFATEEEAGRYLLHLMDHPAEYLEYLAWREEWRVVGRAEAAAADTIPPSFLCALCEHLHKEEEPYSYRSDTSNTSYSLSNVCILHSELPKNGILKNSCCNIPF